MGDINFSEYSLLIYLSVKVQLDIHQLIFFDSDILRNFYLTFLLSLGLIDGVKFKVYYDSAYTAHVLFKAELPLVVGQDLLPYFGQTPILGKYLKMAYNLQIVHGCVSKEQVWAMLRLDYNVK